MDTYNLANLAVPTLTSTWPTRKKSHVGRRVVRSKAEQSKILSHTSLVLSCPFCHRDIILLKHKDKRLEALGVLKIREHAIDLCTSCVFLEKESELRASSEINKKKTCLEICWCCVENKMRDERWKMAR
jgi:superfamily II helicase